MKKIVCGHISLSYFSSNEYMLEENTLDCEYSSEWFQDGNPDPIKEYVENSLDDFDGYEWDLDTGCTIWYGKITIGTIFHILYYQGKPIELYWVE